MFDKATAEDQILHTNKRSVKEQFNNMDKIGFDGFVEFFEVWLASPTSVFLLPFLHVMGEGKWLLCAGQQECQDWTGDDHVSLWNVRRRHAPH